MRILLQIPGASRAAWRDEVAAALPEAGLTVWPDVADAPDYALVWKPPPEFFARVRPTRAIFNLGAGVDALLAVPTLPADVPVIRLEDAGMAEQMAEYVTLAVLSAFREAVAYAAQQRDAVWKPRPRLAKARFGVGILGYGVLGKAVARALAGFAFPLAAWRRARGPSGPAAAMVGDGAPDASRSAAAAPAGDGAPGGASDGAGLRGVATFAGRDQLGPFLARSMVLVCLLPSTPATRGLLDRATLGRLPRGAHLVNVGRGDLVVDGDLLALLDGGHLAGATLDVFHEEPLPAAHPFWHHPRIAVTPHTAAATLIDVSIAQVAAKIRRLERGEAVSGVVDRQRGY